MRPRDKEQYPKVVACIGCKRKCPHNAYKRRNGAGCVQDAPKRDAE